MKLLPLLLLPTFALANEAQLACDLERSKAETQASILASPAVVGGAGQDAASGEKSLNLGISQSLSGRTRASKLREAAEAKCDAVRATLQLEELNNWAILLVQRSAAQEELAAIEVALAQAKANLELLQPQLEARTITIQQFNEAYVSLAGFEGRQAELLRQLSVVPVVPTATSVPELLERARSSEARAAQLLAESSAAAGWDVVVAGGARQPLSGPNTGAEPFVGLTFRWSFGGPAASRAARDVGETTGKLFDAASAGYQQIANRQREQLRKLIAAERQRAAALHQQRNLLISTMQPLQGIETALAQNVLRTLNLQHLRVKAELVGTISRIQGYNQLLDKLG